MYFQFVERRDKSGASSVEQQEARVLGFCPDLEPDLTVGRALEWLLVGSQDVAQDIGILRQLGVTHILNVAFGVSNAFPNVRLVILADFYWLCLLNALPVTGLYLPDSAYVWWPYTRVYCPLCTMPPVHWAGPCCWGNSTYSLVCTNVPSNYSIFTLGAPLLIASSCRC